MNMRRVRLKLVSFALAVIFFQEIVGIFLIPQYMTL